MKMLKVFAALAVLALLALTAGACTAATTTTTGPTSTTAPTSGNTGSLTVYVTDARPDRDITGIVITVSELQVHLAEAVQQQEQAMTGNQTQLQEQQQVMEGEGEWITIPIEGDAGTFDLLDVAGIEQQLSQLDIAAGTYTQVRLVVSSAQVEFDGSGTFEDARVPSGELKIVRPFTVVEGEPTELVLDFIAEKMVNVTGGGSGNGNSDIIVKPVVKMAVRQNNAPVPGNEDPVEPEPVLEDTAWQLQSFGPSDNVAPVIEGTTVTATFNSADGTVTGSTGCNSYFADYTLDGPSLTVGVIGQTEMACMEEGVMEQEQAYVTALAAMETYAIADNTLTITGGGYTLIFVLES